MPMQYKTLEWKESILESKSNAKIWQECWALQIEKKTFNKRASAP